MKTFTIDAENNIMAHASPEEAVSGAERFATEAELNKLAANWPAERLVEIWNGLAGVKPVTKFANRKSATERIWKVIQSLGEQAAAPVLETPFDAPGPEVATTDLPVLEPKQADAETVHPPRPSHSPLLTLAIPAKAFGRPASALRVKSIRGLTGSHCPLYSAGFATSAFRRV